MNKYKVEPVRLLPQEEFARLSQEDKLAYITRMLRELTRHGAATAAAQDASQEARRLPSPLGTLPIRSA